MRSKKSKQSGQVIVEYVLLIVLSVGLASLIVRQLVNRNDQDPGALTGKWHAIVQAISADQPEK